MTQQIGKPEVDLFASRHNYQVQMYFSWRPDSGSKGIDVMQENRESPFGYGFPPFCMIGKILAKVKKEKARILIVTPTCHTAVNVCEESNTLTQGKKCPVESRKMLSSPKQPAATSCLDGFGEVLAEEGLSTAAAELLFFSFFFSIQKIINYIMTHLKQIKKLKDMYKYKHTKGVTLVNI